MFLLVFEVGLKDREKWKDLRKAGGRGRFTVFLRQIFLFAHYLLFHTLTPQNRTGGSRTPRSHLTTFLTLTKGRWMGRWGLREVQVGRGATLPRKSYLGSQRSTPWSLRNRKEGQVREVGGVQSPTPRQIQPCDHVLLFRIFDSYHGFVAFMSAFMAFISVAFFS